MRYHQQLKYSFIFIVIFTGLLLTACGGVQAQDKTFTIGVVNLTPVLENTVASFKKSMTELGYIEGENITYIYEGPTNTIDKLDPVAQGLVAADVDLILSLTTPASQAAQRATAGTDIPVVFVPVTDPVGAGLVDSLKQPGGNITGVAFGVQEGRRLEWLVQIAPTIEQIYIVYNPNDQSAVLALETASATATKLGVELITREAHNPDEVMAALENIPGEADAIFLLPDGMVGTRTAEIIEAANKLKLPTSAPNDQSIEPGVLTVYGTREDATAKQGARLADQILRGTKPADLPVEMAEFFLAINLKTAEAIGLDIPDEILRQADIVVR